MDTYLVVPIFPTFYQRKHAVPSRHSTPYCYVSRLKSLYSCSSETLLFIPSLATLHASTMPTRRLLVPLLVRLISPMVYPSPLMCYAVHLHHILPLRNRSSSTNRRHSFQKITTRLQPDGAVTHVSKCSSHACKQRLSRSVTARLH